MAASFSQLWAEWLAACPSCGLAGGWLGFSDPLEGMSVLWCYWLLSGVKGWFDDSATQTQVLMGLGSDQRTPSTSSRMEGLLLVSGLRIGHPLISNADLQPLFILSHCTSNHFGHNPELSQDQDPTCSWSALLWLWLCFQQMIFQPKASVLKCECDKQFPILKQKNCLLNTNILLGVQHSQIIH